VPNRYANPFTPQTQIGAGFNNLAAALFAGKNAEDNAALRASQAASYDAHAALYDEQRRKAEVDRLAAEAEARARESAPLDFVRTIVGDAPRAQQVVEASRAGNWGMRPQALDPQEMEQVADFGTPAPQDIAIKEAPAWYTPDMQRKVRIGQQAFALGAGGTGKSSAFDLARAMEALSAEEQRDRIIAGELDPTPVGQAHFATSGKAPFDSMSGKGTFNLATGIQSLNEIGQADAAADRALAGQRDAMADWYGRRPGQPKLVQVRGEDGQTIWVPAEEAAGRQVGATPRVPTPPKLAAPRRLTGTDSALIGSALDGFLAEMGVDALDDQARNAVLVQAEREWQAGADGHASAVKAALDKVAPGGFETPWQWRSFVPLASSRAVPRGGPQAGAPAPGSSGESLPPQARARLKEGVVTKFANGQSWTLQNGVPVQVQ
jgi:hypothetical protein